MSERAALARQLAAKLLPEVRLAEQHVAATYERMCEATSRAMVSVELFGEARDEEELHACAVELNDRLAKARAALLDHTQACISLSQMYNGWS